jgi:hypothetical protein
MNITKGVWSLLTIKILFNWIPFVSLAGGLGLSKECPRSRVET